MYDSHGAVPLSCMAMIGGDFNIWYFILSISTVISSCVNCSFSYSSRFLFYFGTFLVSRPLPVSLSLIIFTCILLHCCVLFLITLICINSDVFSTVLASVSAVSYIHNSLCALCEL